MIDADQARVLAGWLARRLADGSAGDVTDVEVADLERPEAGQSSDLTLFTLTWADGGRRRMQRCVLRRQPAGHAIFLRPDAIREARVLRALARSDVPVPAVRWCEADAGVLGAPFFVMERVDGRVPAAKPSIHAVGWLTMLTVAERERLWHSAMAALVAVHRVDWRRTHAFLLDGDAATGTLDGHLARLAAWYEWTTAGREFPVTDAALRRLRSERSTVEDDEPVLVWGDARVGNIIFAEDHRVAALIDWEVASIGHPAIDLAHWTFFDEFATGACGVDRLPGWPGRDETIARYAELAGRPVADIAYFELMEELFIATTLIRQADRHVTAGRLGPGTRMGHDNVVTQMLARRLDLPVPEIDPDYLAHRAMAS
jgi:aminoglycoside phosphotransferase (APT) family kinase protein